MKKSRWQSDEDNEVETHETNAAKEVRDRKRREKKAKKAKATESTEPLNAKIDFSQRVPYRPAQPSPGPPISPCATVTGRFEKLNRISEGTYGIVYRARDLITNEIVALKRLKIDDRHRAAEGFPITSLREICTLLETSQHPHIVNVREIVTAGDDISKVFMVMEFVEHEVKDLMERMKQRFVQSEIKTLMMQLLSAVSHMHQRWIVHRDLKTSNLLINNRGMLKVADFGLARKFSDPLGPMTQMVVTLWYRAPELLMGETQYDKAIDMWSIGCIFAELVRHEPIFPGNSELDQINKLFSMLGTPNDTIWPGFSELPHVKRMRFSQYPASKLNVGYRNLMTEAGFDLLSRLLTFDPKQRISAEAALKHQYFQESPAPKHPTMFPTWPARDVNEEKHRSDIPSEHRKVDRDQVEDQDTSLKTTLFSQKSDTKDFGFRLNA